MSLVNVGLCEAVIALALFTLFMNKKESKEVANAFRTAPCAASKTREPKNRLTQKCWPTFHEAREAGLLSTARQRTRPGTLQISADDAGFEALAHLRNELVCATSFASSLWPTR